MDMGWSAQTVACVCDNLREARVIGKGPLLDLSCEDAQLRIGRLVQTEDNARWLHDAVVLNKDGDARQVVVVAEREVCDCVARAGGGVRQLLARGDSAAIQAQS